MNRSPSPQREPGRNGPSRAGAVIIGESGALQARLACLHEFAAADAPVYIFGETGTGKELIARALHAYSSRSHRPLIAQNCAAIPDTLLQSVLFGHRRGAFTGALNDQIGLFEAADAGTLLLDEVTEMSPLMQGALLRVLQEKELTRIGEVHPRAVDVRVISTSNRDLENEVDAGRFRRDLYFRLLTLRIDLPSLRERTSDIPLLVDHFVGTYNARTGKGVGGCEPDALAALEAYAWPGNVRQLQSELDRACILTPEGEAISVARLSRTVTAAASTVSSVAGVTELPDDASLPTILADVEEQLLRIALDRAGGNKTIAARLLGVSRQRLSQRVNRRRLNSSGVLANEP
jgi:transcriptional regulator with PAS, ATPase and Fis domain